MDLAPPTIYPQSIDFNLYRAVKWLRADLHTKQQEEIDRANAEKLAKAKALKVVDKAVMSAEQILDKKMTRAERRAEKGVKQALLMSIKPHWIGGMCWWY